MKKLRKSLQQLRRPRFRGAVMKELHQGLINGLRSWEMFFFSLLIKRLKRSAKTQRFLCVVGGKFFSETRPSSARLCVRLGFCTRENDQLVLLPECRENSRQLTRGDHIFQPFSWIRAAVRSSATSLRYTGLVFILGFRKTNFYLEILGLCWYLQLLTNALDQELRVGNVLGSQMSVHMGGFKNNPVCQEVWMYFSCVSFWNACLIWQKSCM